MLTFLQLFIQIALINKRLEVAERKLKEQTKTQDENAAIAAKAEQYFYGFTLFFCSTKQLLKKGDSYEFTVNLQCPL